MAVDDQREQILLAALPTLLAWLSAITRETLPCPSETVAREHGAAPDAEAMQQALEYSCTTHYRGHEIRTTTRGRADKDEAAAWTDADWLRHDAISGAHVLLSVGVDAAFANRALCSFALRMQG